MILEETRGQGGIGGNLARAVVLLPKRIYYSSVNSPGSWVSSSLLSQLFRVGILIALFKPLNSWRIAWRSIDLQHIKERKIVSFCQSFSLIQPEKIPGLSSFATMCYNFSSQNLDSSLSHSGLCWNLESPGEPALLFCVGECLIILFVI